jgi:2-hydroxycyclohexanecarboxyl-CoA dehydrogenase
VASANWKGCGHRQSYCGSLVMNQALAVELAPWVRVNAICPGYISNVGMAWRGTEARSELEGGSAGDIGDRIAADNIPLLRLQSANVIANTSVFLASDKAREITGDDINVGIVVMQ